MKKILKQALLLVTIILIILSGYFYFSFNSEKNNFAKLKIDYDKLVISYESLVSRVDIAENKVNELTGGMKTIISGQGGMIKGFLPIFSTYQDKILVCAEETSSTDLADMYCGLSTAVSIYELKVPAGKYYVSGRELCSAQEIVNDICKNNISYYTKNSKDLSVKERVVVEVGPGKTVENIDLQ